MKYLLLFSSIISILFDQPNLGAGLAIEDDSPPPMVCLADDYDEGDEYECLVEPYNDSPQYILLSTDILPYSPLLVRSPSPELAVVPYNYAQITSDKARVFSSLESAVEGDNVKRIIWKGYKYVSYNEMTFVNGKTFYNIGNGEWMRSADLSANVQPTRFMGVEVIKPPENKFGWVLFNNQTYREPGYNYSKYTGKWLERHQIIQVYETREVNGYEWYLVAPNQWVEQRKVALIDPRPKTPHGIENGRWIEINLFEQTLAVFEHRRLVYGTLVTSGSRAFYTRPGLFKIWDKLEVTNMQGGDSGSADVYYLEDVPWTMYFDQARGLHGEYWHDHLGYQSSHGCVNLSFVDAHWLFDWAEEGDWVYVWDPSGKTPVVPSLFSQLIEEQEKADTNFVPPE
jgi:hypothetical protein